MKLHVVQGPAASEFAGCATGESLQFEGIVGGKIIKIGPRGPLFKALAEISNQVAGGQTGRTKRASK